MCLTSISKQPRELLSYRQRYGWKTFTIINNFRHTGELSFAIYKHNGRNKVPMNRWIVSHAKSRMVDYDIKYAPRFHVYLRRPVYGIVRKVLFRYPVATGYQFGRPIVVASRIKVLYAG
jgi:hypothetical protein